MFFHLYLRGKKKICSPKKIAGESLLELLLCLILFSLISLSLGTTLLKSFSSLQKEKEKEKGLVLLHNTALLLASNQSFQEKQNSKIDRAPPLFYGVDAGGNLLEKFSAEEVAKPIRQSGHHHIVGVLKLEQTPAKHIGSGDPPTLTLEIGVPAKLPASKRVKVQLTR